jgi:hypothetical protein
MHTKSIIFGIAIAALPMAASAQALVEPSTLPPNFGEAPASRVSDPESPRNFVRQVLAQAAKQNATKPVPLRPALVQPQNKQLAMAVPSLPKPAPFVQSAPPPPPPVTPSFAPRRSVNSNPEVEISERVTYSQEGDLVRMKIVRDFKVDGHIVRSESAEMLGKPGQRSGGRPSGKREKSKAGDFAPRSDFDKSQAQESEGPLY